VLRARRHSFQSRLAFLLGVPSPICSFSQQLKTLVGPRSVSAVVNNVPFPAYWCTSYLHGFSVRTRLSSGSFLPLLFFVNESFFCRLHPATQIDNMSRSIGTSFSSLLYFTPLFFLKGYVGCLSRLSPPSCIAAYLFFFFASSPPAQLCRRHHRDLVFNAFTR